MYDKALFLSFEIHYIKLKTVQSIVAISSNFWENQIPYNIEIYSDFLEKEKLKNQADTYATHENTKSIQQLRLRLNGVYKFVYFNDYGYMIFSFFFFPFFNSF